MQRFREMEGPRQADAFSHPRDGASNPVPEVLEAGATGFY